MVVVRNLLYKHYQISIDNYTSKILKYKKFKGDEKVVSICNSEGKLYKKFNFNQITLESDANLIFSELSIIRNEFENKF
jgi:hypothetical protein